MAIVVTLAEDSQTRERGMHLRNRRLRRKGHEDRENDPVRGESEAKGRMLQKFSFSPDLS